MKRIFYFKFNDESDKLWFLEVVIPLYDELIGGNIEQSDSVFDYDDTEGLKVDGDAPGVSSVDHKDDSDDEESGGEETDNEESDNLDSSKNDSNLVSTTTKSPTLKLGLKDQSYAFKKSL